MIIREYTLDDAESIADIISVIVDERQFTMMRKFTVEEEIEFLENLGESQTVHVAETEGRVVGFQSLDRPWKYSDNTKHIGMIGTFILPDYRRRGIATSLSERTFDYARRNGYESIIVYVRETNEPSIAYHLGLGFEKIGRFKEAEKVDDVYYDRIIMQKFLYS